MRLAECPSVKLIDTKTYSQCVAIKARNYKKNINLFVRTGSRRLRVRPDEYRNIPVFVGR